MTFASASLHDMNPTERRAVLDASFEVSSDSVRIKLLEIGVRVRRYESRYEISSAELPAALAANTIQETAEICDWIFWVKIRERLERARP